MTLTTSTRDYKKNKLSCGSIHSVHESLDVLVSCHMLQFIAHGVGLVALYFMSPIQWLSMHQTYSLSVLYGNSLKRCTLRKWTCEVLSSHRTPIFTASCLPTVMNLRSCSIIFKIRQKLECVHQVDAYFMWRSVRSEDLCFAAVRAIG